MADNVVVTAGTGTTIAADELTDGTLGSVKVQYVKLMDGTLDGSTKAAVGANGLAVDVKASVLPTGAATSAKQDTGNTSLATIATNLPAQGQALAAASTPVVLTAAQITTLTPPAAITGFATAAKQPALGTAGTASSDVITIQGIASGTVVPISVASIPSHAVTNAGTFAVQSAEADGANVTLGSKADAKSTATDTTAITAMQVLKQISASVQAPPSQAVTNTGTFAVQSAATLQTQTDTVMVGGVNIKEINAVTPLMGNGVTGTGSQRVTIASDNTAFSVNATLKPATTGGYTTYHLVSAATTNLTNVKASAGQLYGWYIYNSNAAARKLVFHNTSGTPTAGASVFFSVMVPPTSAANVFSDTGIAFSSGIGISTVTGLADNDTAAVALNDLVINLFYN